MKEQVVIVGAGINGLVAANYLQRDGYQVTLLESKPQVGGACASDCLEKDGKSYQYPTAATVLGFMQDFVYKDTGLAERLQVHTPAHPAVVWFEGREEPCFMFNDIHRLRAEVAHKWGETGNIEGYESDLERVRQFLIAGYKNSQVPALADANQILGADLTARWITGDAASLMNHYFKSDYMKVFCSLDVTESGPVSLHAPFSAFTIPLMASGSVFDGRWGFVRGGLWTLVEELAEINQKLGVRILTDARAVAVSPEQMTVSFQQNGSEETLDASQIVFATDPSTAAQLLGETDLLTSVNQKKALGTSGKLVMFFQKPVDWTGDSGEPDFDCAFKFIIAEETMDAIEAASQRAAVGDTAFAPGYYEIYCEGAGMRALGLDRGYDCLTVFFKSLSFGPRGAELPSVKEAVVSAVLKRIINDGDLIDSVLFTPRDLSERFFFPEGNIDHIELCEGQTYLSRHFSPDPKGNFYQFGARPDIRYCAAGSYPCGSIAGTAGYMCAQQISRSRLLTES
jgi:phytoene dehydrogenase-like protein